jgi:hypothetical protein
MTKEQRTARELIEKLPPWSSNDFTKDEWASYFRCAKYIQQLTDAEITQLLEDIQRQFTSEIDGDDLQSKLFIFLRLLFDIPARGDIITRKSFMGWENWPSADYSGQVNLTWPIAWKNKQPFLESPYEGSMGKPYALTNEFVYFKELYPYRTIPQF